MLYTILMSDFLQISFQLLVSEAVFLFGLPKRDQYIRNSVAGISIALLLAYLLQNMIKGPANSYMALAIVLYLGYAVLTIIPILASCEIGLMEVYLF